MTDIGLQLSNLVVARGQNTVLNGLSLKVPAGEVYALLGGNGAGKSTALFAILGLLKAKQGNINIAGHDPSIEPDAVRAVTTYLPETVALYDHLTARENLTYFLALADQKRTQSEIEAAFSAVRLTQLAWKQRIETFSKGMRQKTAIALALLRQTPVLLLDEPTTGLDPSSTHEFYTLLADLKARKVTTLMVTHDLLGSIDVADTIGLMVDGQIVQEWHAQDALPRFDLQSLHRAVSGATSQAQGRPI